MTSISFFKELTSIINLSLIIFSVNFKENSKRSNKILKGKFFKEKKLENTDRPSQEKPRLIPNREPRKLHKNDVGFP